MQIIPLELSHSTFFCPVTGEQLLSEVDHHSSPATLFHYIDIEGGKLVDPKPEIEVLYNKALEEISKGVYDKYKFKHDYSDEAKAFDILVNVKLRDKINYVLFELNNSAIACRPVSNTLFIGIDMNYTPILEPSEIFKRDFENSFVDFENYETVLHNATFIKPSIEGYALFMEDTIGYGGFYFINTLEDWETLIPALVLLDYINQDFTTIPFETFESIKKVYYNYFNAWIYENLPEDFTEDLNAVLTDYKIVFFGKVTDLLDANSEFSIELLEEFDNNPKTHLDDFLTFLSSYSKY
jgi:hypothetical protein